MMTHSPPQVNHISNSSSEEEEEENPAVGPSARERWNAAQAEKVRVSLIKLYLKLARAIDKFENKFGLTFSFDADVENYERHTARRLRLSGARAGAGTLRHRYRRLLSRCRRWQRRQQQRLGPATAAAAAATAHRPTRPSNASQPHVKSMVVL